MVLEDLNRVILPGVHALADRASSVTSFQQLARGVLGDYVEARCLAQLGPTGRASPALTEPEEVTSVEWMRVLIVRCHQLSPTSGGSQSTWYSSSSVQGGTPAS